MVTRWPREIKPNSHRLWASKKQGISPVWRVSVRKDMPLKTAMKMRLLPTMDRKASVVWKGNLREGNGTLTTESGVLLDTQYSFRTRFAEGIGTNPDELIAAALGGCFSMALSNELGRAGFHPESIETTTTATMEELPVGWTLTRMLLEVRAKVPEVSQAIFIDAALAAKTNCPVARLLKTNISMTTSLEL